MRCIRCHAEDTDDAKFCRACGFPAALNDFVACSVCGGEVHVDVKVCPGCHHQFALPVPWHPESRVPRRNLGRNLFLPAVAAIASAFLVYNLPKTDSTRVASVTETPRTEPKTTSDSSPPVFGADGQLAGVVNVSNSTMEVSKPHKVHVIYVDVLDGPEAKKREAKPVRAKQRSAQRKIVAAAKPTESLVPAEPLEAQQTHVALAVEEKFTPKSSNYFAREIERWHFCQGKWNANPDCPHYPDHKPNW
ncbi:MAG: zinc ribbon domain-containing protein [Burkholderiales bacterium]